MLVVVALVFTTGAHWAALQTAAWSAMLARNLCHDSLSGAVTKTFDGQHPCCLCRAIAAAKQSEKKSETVSPQLKMEFPPVPRRLELIPPASFKSLPIPDFFADSLCFPPPLPPPRTCRA